MRELRERRACGILKDSLEYDEVKARQVMTAAQFNDRAERCRILSEILEDALYDTPDAPDEIDFDEN